MAPKPMVLILPVAERRVAIDIDGEQVYEPGIAVYPFAGQRIGIPSVRSTLFDDVALSVDSFPVDADGNETGQVVLRVTVQPLIVWLWIGGLVMALGTLLAVVPGKRRNPTAPVSAPLPDAEPPATTEPAKELV